MLPASLQQAPAGAVTPSSLAVDSSFALPQQTAEIDPELVGREQAAAAGLGAIRGLRYALIAQGAVFLVLGGLWLLWRTLR